MLLSIELVKLFFKYLTEEVSILSLRIYSKPGLGDFCFQSLEISFNLVDFII